MSLKMQEQRSLPNSTVDGEKSGEKGIIKKYILFYF